MNLTQITGSDVRRTAIKINPDRVLRVNRSSASCYLTLVNPPEEIEVLQTPDEIRAQIRLIKVTAQNDSGYVVWVNPKHIVSVEPTGDGSIIKLDSFNPSEIIAKETPKQIEASSKRVSPVI